MFEKMTVAALRALCTERGIAFKSRDLKATLIGKLGEMVRIEPPAPRPRQGKTKRRESRLDVRRAKRRGRAATRAARARWV